MTDDLCPNPTAGLDTCATLISLIVTPILPRLQADSSIDMNGRQVPCT